MLNEENLRCLGHVGVDGRADVEGWTPLAEAVAPGLVAEFLNEYYELTTRVVFAHGGSVNEFVGDSVLGLAVAEWLYRNHPGLSEGDLTMMKHRLVSTTTLAAIAEELGLGDFVRLGRGEQKTGGREKPAILADTLEALIGAIFFDNGYAAASASVGRIFADRLNRATPGGSTDYKTMLQERLQAAKLAAPTYAVIRSEGMPHSRTFVVEARWDGGNSVGTGHSIKSAEMMAASEALNALNAEETARKE